MSEASIFLIPLPEVIASKVEQIKLLVDKSIQVDDDQHPTHISLLYDLEQKEVDSRMRGIIKLVKPFWLELSGYDFFDTEENDVVFIKVSKSESLDSLHTILKSKFKNKDSFPKFVPHVCIAYVKKGKAKGVIEKLPSFADGFWLDSINFSSSDATQQKLTFWGIDAL